MQRRLRIETKYSYEEEQIFFSALHVILGHGTLASSNYHVANDDIDVDDNSTNHGNAGGDNSTNDEYYPENHYDALVLVSDSGEISL